MFTTINRIFFSILQKIMLVLGFHWICVAVIRLGMLGLWALPLGAILLGLVWYFRKKLLALYQRVIKHKWQIMLVALLVQLLFLLSAELLIRRDAAVVFNGAFGYIKELSIASYLTRNPNNLFLFLYERFFFRLLGEVEALWVMQGLNLLYVNLAALVLYQGTKRHFSQTTADAAFAFYMVFLGFSPYFYSMYTDIPPLPLIAWQIFLALDILKSSDKKKIAGKSILLGAVTGLVVLMRPPGFVLLIAFFMVLILKGNHKKSFLVLLPFLLSFGLVFGSGNYMIKNQSEVTLIEGEGLSKSALLFVNLGLTRYGHNQEDMKEGLLQYVEPENRDKYNNGMFKDEYVLKEIQRRLADFTPLTFLWHLTLKQSIAVSDGALGWPYTSLAKEKTTYINPLYSYTKDNQLAEWVRQFVLMNDHPNYAYYVFGKQLVWIFLSIGFFLAFRGYRREESWDFLSLAVFGGFLFLLVFEGGKTRYLIQFLPQIILLASLGLTQRKKN